MNESITTVLAVGDLVLNIPDVDFIFDAARATLLSGDVVIGHVEIPHTTRPAVSNFETSIVPAGDPENLNCLPKAGFNVATFGGNHTFDQGEPGVADTLNNFKSLGLQTTGAGMDIYEAHVPAYIDKNGVNFAIVQYTALGPRESWASPMKAGAAYIRVITTYICDRAEPGSAPTAVYTAVDPGTLNWMVQDIEEAKKKADVVIASFHIGRMGSPDLLPYEFEITHKAIDVGAEMVICCHAHSLRGVDMYKGKPVFHGLGNFATVTNHFQKGSEIAMKLHSYNPFKWQGVTPPFTPFADPQGGYTVPNYPSSEISRNTLIAKGVFTKDGLVEARMIPCYINDKAQPQPVTREGKGMDVLAHVMKLNEIENLKTVFTWNEEGSEIILS